MGDEEYLDKLMSKATTSDVAEYSWYECVEGFKQADRDMGSAFHRKLEWMNRAEDAYIADNDKRAGFLVEFSDSTGISYQYAKRMNVIRKTFVPHEVLNFSHNALDLLVSAPKELQEDFLSSKEPVKVNEVREAKKEYKQIQEEPQYADLFEKVKQKEITPRQAIEEKKARMPVERAYDLVDAMGAITGIAWLYAKNYKGTSEDAADVLVQEIVGACEDGDDIDLSIAKDRVKWFLEFKEALDYAEPALREFLTDKPNLKIVK